MMRADRVNRMAVVLVAACVGVGLSVGCIDLAEVVNPVVVNTPPTADAGPNIETQVGAAVTLSGLSSSDADGDALTCTWTQTAGYDLGLGDYVGVELTIVCGRADTYEFTLTVTDDRGGSDSDTVRVFVKAADENRQDPPADPDGDDPAGDDPADDDEEPADDGNDDDVPAGPVVSTFDASDEGWRIQGDHFPAPTVPYWNVDGFVSVEGTDTAYWIAPTSFHGDRSDLYGQTLSYQYRGSVRKGQALVILGGDGLRAVYKAHHANDWFHVGVSVRLDETESWYDMATGQRISAAQMQAILGNLSELRLCATAHFSSGTCVLDNVSLGTARTAPAAPIETRFDDGEQGWRLQGSVESFAVIVPPYWHPDGYLTAYACDTAYWIAPWGILGNHAAALDGTLSVDVLGRWNAGYGQVVLSGGGHTLYYVMADALLWQQATIAIRMNETGGWYDAATEQLASRNQIREVLTDLTEMRIIATNHFSLGDVALDNVLLQPAE